MLKTSIYLLKIDKDIQIKISELILSTDIFSVALQRKSQIPGELIR